MNNSFLRTALALLCLPILISCNLYAPLTSSSSDEDKLEEGQKCLHDGNYECALEAYNGLSDGVRKQEKLCMVYLSRTGVTLSALINTINKSSSSMLGSLANTLIPWTAEKQTAADGAKDACLAYAAAAPGQELPALLQTVSVLSHCAIRMAKTDQLVASSDSDTTCTTAGNKSGTVTKADISDNSNGTITAGGMCPSDVLTCQTDVLLIDPNGLSNAGLGDLTGAYNSLPAALKTSTAATAAVRSALRDTVAN